MGYQRSFDEEPTRVSDLACVNDGLGVRSWALALTTTDLHVDDLPPCIYRAFVEGMDPSLTVALCLTRTRMTVPLPLPTPNTWSGPPPVSTDPTPSNDSVAIFPGNMVVRVRVMSGLQALNVRLLSGTGTLYLVPVLLGL